MAWTNLIAAIDAVITSNGANQITGQILREILTLNIVPQLGAAKFKGIAVPATSPGTPQSDVFFLASEKGTYSNFGGAVIAKAGIYAFRYSGSAWVLDTILAIEDSDIVGDRYATTSADSRALKASGSISFTVKPFLHYVQHQDILIVNDAANFMRATVDSYDSDTGALVATITKGVGAGTYNSWEINLGSNVPTWGTILGTLSNQTDLQAAFDLKATVAALNAVVSTADDLAAIVSGLSTDLSTLSDAVTLNTDFVNRFDLSGSTTDEVLTYDGTEWVSAPGAGGNLPNLVEGEMVIGNASNQGVAITRQNLGQQKPLFEKSVFGAFFKISMITAWDALERADTTTVPLGTADSGQAYVQLEGTNNYSGGASTRSITGVGITGISATGLLQSSSARSGFRLDLSVLSGGTIRLGGAVLWVDSDNYVKIVAAQNNIQVIEKVGGGAETVLASELFPNQSLLARNPIDLVISYTGSSSLLGVASVVGQNQVPAVSITAFANGTEINYFGFLTTADASVTNWALTKASFV